MSVVNWERHYWDPAYGPADRGTGRRSLASTEVVDGVLDDAVDLILAGNDTVLAGLVLARLAMRAEEQDRLDLNAAQRSPWLQHLATHRRISDALTELLRRGHLTQAEQAKRATRTARVVELRKLATHCKRLGVSYQWVPSFRRHARELIRRAATEGAPFARNAGLPPASLRTLLAVAGGLSTPDEIAGALGVTDRTVRTHLSRLRDAGVLDGHLVVVEAITGAADPAHAERVGMSTRIGPTLLT